LIINLKKLSFNPIQLSFKINQKSKEKLQKEGFICHITIATINNMSGHPDLHRKSHSPQECMLLLHHAPQIYFLFANVLIHLVQAKIRFPAKFL
jgi:hypothetical protein